MIDKQIKQEIAGAIETHKRMVCELETAGLETVFNIAEATIKTLKQNGRLYICGNGGSAADAQHIAAELVGKFRRQRKALPAVALTTDTSIITSVSNDYSYEEVFSRQIEALVGRADMLWAVSTSGSSANVITAAESAKEKDAAVVAFTGRCNSELERIADICFCCCGDCTARSQEIHQLVFHIICDLVEYSFTEHSER